VKHVTLNTDGVINAVLGNSTSETTEIADDDARYIVWVAAREAEQYINNRMENYSSIGDQLDMQYWDEVNGTTNWKDHIATVKAAYPKPV
jgi:hypothetical protein